jgi:hypothetical protein
MEKRKANHKDATDLGRFLAIGQRWRGIARRIDSQNPTCQITIKSFSVRCKLGRETEYDSRYFVVLRASYGTKDIVKFRRLGNLENLGHVLEEMIRRETDWRDDKYGTD